MPQDIISVLPDGTRIFRKAQRVGERVYHSKQWYLRRWSRGRSVHFSLGRNFQAAARKAREIEIALRELRQPFDEIVTKYRYAEEQPETPATVGAVIDFVEAHQKALELTPRTTASYCRALAKVVRVALRYRTGETPTDEAVNNAYLSIVDHRLASEFKKASTGGVTDNLALRRTKRTVNSVLRNAKAMFSRRLCDEFSSAGLVVPSMEGFLSTPFYTKVNQRYALPDPELIVAVMEAINGRSDIFDRNGWIVAMLAAHAGLRHSEAAFARWTWLRATGEPHIMIQPECDFEPKSGRGRRIPLSPCIYQRLVAENDCGMFVVSGGVNERKDDCMRRLTAALRTLGISADKPIHELRKWFGSYVAHAFSLTRAQALLGHSSHQTTCDYYADLSFDQRLARCWKVD